MNFLSFKDVNWLKMHPLNDETALDYFSTSPFYDHTCNNEQLKMQNIQKVLSTGIEYKVSNLIIEKFERPNENTLEIYYILNGTIYMAPTLFNTISSRLTTAAFYLKDTPFHKLEAKGDEKDERFMNSILNDFNELLNNEK